MARLCFDYGHGGLDSGACYKGRKESYDVLSIGKAAAAEVRKYGVTVDETRTSDVTVSLEKRSSFENRGNYDYFISFHRNAYQPEKAKGVETYAYINTGTKAKSLAQSIQTSLAALGFIDRGVKTANFHVLRETKAPAVLIEVGFIDNSADNNLFDAKRNEIIRAIAKAILSQLGISYTEKIPAKQISTQKTVYRIMSGSFSSRENAEVQLKKLKAAGFDACIMIYN
ncbi:MAG: N-acetylmuramoyl-L-alanine amidase [Clostridium sp.]|jgi:N-acetylmuramoyl-L-alanine amidase|uniref:N-acetylmuramoyl-L-alanine amidase n=1 Tax=Clostridium sp. TaxID=1506 RepID=UPI0025BC1177|nr:N-acetylmuramoyl-L-alanine amidase [Clostridium sp.]MCH3964539.1 N-acetylmuramoyl-L-alanine amidase [Clostridium sp.]MCI1715010.1 N-acetylmuramoyl-L-alanine amidase [Clostridium sp.]MCI1799272.1 N-acetylmuramoyl-L-alanine amidase [Clostridium sp.]MCI1813193.1 N-acetylmuramoyl-L-alanine amidase [Clostridium sp.]MCI1870084.1 N-acetylmuramoyl-L-alanine amidase [Clostridium sp.]